MTKRKIDINDYPGLLKVKVFTSRGSDQNWFKTLLKSRRNQPDQLLRWGNHFTNIKPWEKVIAYFDPVDKEWYNVR